MMMMMMMVLDSIHENLVALGSSARILSWSYWIMRNDISSSWCKRQRVLRSVPLWCVVGGIWRQKQLQHISYSFTGSITQYREQSTMRNWCTGWFQIIATILLHLSLYFIFVGVSCSF
jgi:hypothetical protein